MVWIVMIALVLSYIVVDRYGKQQTKEQNKQKRIVRVKMIILVVVIL